MKINIVFVGPFPVGMAATNRLTSYARGLANQGNEINLLLLRGSEKHNQAVNKNKSGIYKDIKFSYLTSNIAPNNYFLKMLYALIGIIKSMFKVKKGEVVIFHAVDKPSIILATLMYILIDIKAFWIRDEKPIILNNFYWRALVNFTFQGIIVMTNEINAYIKAFLPAKKTFVLPITIDFDRFNVPENKIALKYKNYFCYVGLNNPKRDGFELLLQAFLKYKSSYNSNECLLCIGDANKPDVQNIIAQYKTYPHFSSIVFLGKYSGLELITFMKNSMALITTPIYIESLGFPSKLAEYLASKRPVITTNVGEIPTFLSKNSAILCYPEISDISAALHFVSTNVQIADEIGKNGYSTAEKYFNIDTYINELSNFLYV